MADFPEWLRRPRRSVVGFGDLEGELQVIGWMRRAKDLDLALLLAPFLDLVEAFGSLGAHALYLIGPLVAGADFSAQAERLAALLDRPDILALAEQPHQTEGQ